MIQIATDPSQSARLQVCGVNPKSADFVWMQDNPPRLTLRTEIIEDGNPYILAPAWSLSALLALLPKEIDIDGYTYRISIYFENPGEPIIGNQWCLYYKPKKRNERGRIDDVTMYATDLIECAVLMVEYLTKNGYKLNEIKQ